MSVPALPAQRLEFAALVERLTTSRWPPIVATLLALALLTHSLAQWSWQLLTPKSVAPPPVATAPPVDTGAALRDLLAANIFGLPDPGTASLLPNQIPPTSLNLKLTGVLVRGKGSYALVRAEGGEELPVVVGNEIQPGARLHAVYPDRIIIARAGLFESLILKDTAPPLADGSIVTSAARAAGSSPVVRNEGGRYTVNRQSMNQQMQKPEFLSQALIVPNAGGGFLVREVQPDSIYSKLGVRVGDVIRSVNGQPVNSVDDVMKIYQQLGGMNEAGSVALDVTRGGENKSLQYSFE